MQYLEWDGFVSFLECWTNTFKLEPSQKETVVSVYEFKHCSHTLNTCSSVMPSVTSRIGHFRVHSGTHALEVLFMHSPWTAYSLCIVLHVYASLLFQLADTLLVWYVLYTHVCLHSCAHSSGLLLRKRKFWQSLPSYWPSRPKTHSCSAVSSAAYRQGWLSSSSLTTTFCRHTWTRSVGCWIISFVHVC